MSKLVQGIETVRVSRAGHTFHERWAARRAMQLVFPKDNLFAIVVEGLPSHDPLKLVKEAEDIADLVLFYGTGDTFSTCDAQQILQFKYKKAKEPVTSSYLKKTIQKFAATLRDVRSKAPEKEVAKKLSFGFVTNAVFSDDLWEAIESLKSNTVPKSSSAKSQSNYLKTWCDEEKIEATDIFPLIEFRASTDDLPSQNRSLRRVVSDWSANSSGQAAIRLLALIELVREKAQIEGQVNNSIRREDVLDALECDEDQLFPADTRFIDVGEIVERSVAQTVEAEIDNNDAPVFLYADGGVGKTIFIQSLALHLAKKYEVVVFDCFGGGSYRNEAQARHLPKIGLLQIINELAARGLCDPILPTDSDQYGLIEVACKRLKQASETVQNQSTMQGILIILDAADNAQLEADARNEVPFPRLLLASISSEPIEGVKLLLTARPHRMDSVVGTSQVKRLELEPFTEEETRIFLEARRTKITDLEFSTAIARSKGNARVLEYLVESWDTNISGNAPQTEISVEELIAEKCNKIFADLHTIGWSEGEVGEFFAALALLPPPIPLNELAKALSWSNSQVSSAASDLAPMLELVKHGAIFRDEPTETYIKDHYANEATAQQAIAHRLQEQQKDSIYAAEALPHFLVVIGDSDRAYQLAGSNEFPSAIESEYGRRRLKLARLYAAFSLSTHDKNLDRVLSLAMQLSQVASANAKGDQFIRQSPALATTLGGLDASRRLFNDRSGWRGSRDARLIVAYCFSDELDEAHIHQNRAIGWINWYLNADDEKKRDQRSSLEASDMASVLFLNVLKNKFFSFNRNIQFWRFKFALSIVNELIALCVQYEISSGGKALKELARFAASKKCLSLTLQIGLLSKECGLSKRQLKSISRAASTLALRYKKKIPKDNIDYEEELPGAISDAAMSCLVTNSKQSAKRLLKLYRQNRPSAYDYGERHGINNIWASVLTACIAAWSSGKELSFCHLIPENIKIGKQAKSVVTEPGLNKFLDSLVETTKQKKRGNGEKQKRFSQHEREDIVKGVSCILKLVAPVEKALLFGAELSNDILAEFLSNWEAELRPSIHWNAETGKDGVTRQVGLGLVKLLLRFSDAVAKKEAEELIKIIGANRFSLGDKLSLLALLARRKNLADVTGVYANAISDEIIKDDYIEQRGDSYRNLAVSLMPLSIHEAQEYYTQGLAQLDQMGSDDYDLIYSALNYSAEQHGGFVKPELSHRLMNLCQAIFQHEPSKFGWALFGRAASTSIGFPAIYKLIRWHDQDIIDFSYGLPQLVCFLAKEKHLDARRSAVLLAICEDHGWYEWQVGKGVQDLLSVAEREDREPIFKHVVNKLDCEHNFGGWEGLWESLLECMESFDEIKKDSLRDHLKALYEEARLKRETKNSKQNQVTNNVDQNLQLHRRKKIERSPEKEISSIVHGCDPASVSSLDEALQHIRSSDELPYDGRNRFLEELQKNCSFENRLKYLEALCESNELGFDNALDQIMKNIEVWKDSTSHVKTNIPNIIERLFAFKGSELFDLRYSGVTRQINRLSELYSDPKFVIQIVLETIAKERLELGGDEWLQLGTSLSCHTDPSVALAAFEDLLSSPSAKLGDEIGEGEYKIAYAGKTDQVDVVADIIWHLLGDSDAFIRWSAARSIKGMLDLELLEDVECLLDRFDIKENQSLASEEYNFSFLNAQQWFLMGLSRAALHHGDKLKPLAPKLRKLVKRTDLHVVNKIHIARCLTHIEDDQSANSYLTKLWHDLLAPAAGVVERNGWPDRKERKIDFSFDYEFTKSQPPILARLFGISINEASDCIAEEAIKYFPEAKSTTDLPGTVRYRGGDRYETYPEHIQRHAYLSAASKLAKKKPVVRSSSDWSEYNPWREFWQGSDVSFEDGSWLSDHKDRVPVHARECLLGEPQGDQESLLEKDTLFQKIGFSLEPESQFVPLYGSWLSPDGVRVYLNSALLNERGSVGKSAEFSKLPDYELWLPSFNPHSGRIDRDSERNPFTPLIWTPEKYPIGIDESDKWASREAFCRPKLGLMMNKILKLTPDQDERNWYDRENNLLLKSDVWGEWRPSPDTHQNQYQDEGSILWADTVWLDEVLKSCSRSLIYKFDFSKYKSSRSYDDSSGVKGVYIGLRRSDKQFRLWAARKASKTTY